MHTTGIFTWHQPMDTSIYPPLGNPCAFLLENALCYIISGLMLLVVGVIMTSLTFQNLETDKNENVNRYAGPVLIGAGILVIARGALSHLCPQRSQFARQRSLLRRYVRELYTRPILGLPSDPTDLCDIHVSDSQEISTTLQESPRPSRPNPPLFLSGVSYCPGPPSYSSTPYSPLPPVYTSAPGSPHTPRPSFFTSRLRMYSDEPPPYDFVISEEYLVANPLNETGSNLVEEVFLREDTESSGGVEVSQRQEGVDLPPPSYEEFLRTSAL